MKAKDRANAACVLIAPVLAAVSAYFLYSDRFALALIAILGSVVCMETRVRMGYRGPRQVIFAAHLALSVAYLAALISLLIGMHALWLTPLAWFSFLGMAVSGALLLRQSWNRAI